VDRACAALTVVAPFLGASQLQVVA